MLQPFGGITFTEVAMTKQEIASRAPVIRAGFITFALFSIAFYIGVRMSGMLGGRMFSSAEVFGGCVSFYDYVMSWVRLVCPAMVGFLLVFVSAFSPFCPIVSAAVIVRQAFCLGLEFALFSPGCAAIFTAELFASLAAAVFAAISLAAFPSLRRMSFKRNDPSLSLAARYGADFLVISGFSAFVYLPAAVISHIF